MIIPSLTERSASIIDGQHRLHAFDKLPTDALERSMELLCVVFLELPTPYHAYVFATINFNQKRVDRSLAYELFGFDVDERPVQWLQGLYRPDRYQYEMRLSRVGGIDAKVWVSEELSAQFH